MDVLSAIPSDSCLFQDLTSLSTPAALKDIIRLKPPANADRETREIAYQAVGAYLSQNSDRCFAEKVPCNRHGGPCPVHRKDDIGDALTAFMVGTICKEFSSRGKHEKEASETSAPYFIWVAMMRHFVPVLVFHEITPTAPAQEMLTRDLGDLYHITSTKVCPTRIRHPHVRERQCTVMHRKGLATFDDS